MTARSRLLPLLLLALAGPARADDAVMQPMIAQPIAPIAPSAPLPGNAPGAEAAPELDPIARLVQEAATRMRAAATQVPLTGDPDRDFANQAIVQLQALVALAKAEQDHGRDPDLRETAAGIIARQAEIERLQDWLAAHPAP